MSKIDLSCPVEIFSTALPTEEIPAATLTLFNLSDRVISSVEVLLRMLDRNGGEIERLAFRGRALNGRPHSTFLLTVPCAPSAGFKGLDAAVEKVWFADNDTWRRDPAREVEYTPNALPVSKALTNLKYSAGETAVGYPSRQEGLWVCVCGRPNPEGEDCCVRCGRQAEMVFSRFTPGAVEAQVSMKERQLDLNSRNMREDTIRMQRMREEEYLRKKARRGNRLRLLAAMALTLALCAGAMFLLGPWLRLSAGRYALENGNAAGAKEVLSSLGTFGGADQLLEECDWQAAQEAAEKAATAEEMGEASALLRAVKDRPEAVEKANEIDLLRARLLLGNNEWQEALDALSLLPEDYEGRKELEASCLNTEAWALWNIEEYEAARNIWLSLGDMPGAKEQAAMCVYEPAKILMAAKDWDGAISMLSMIPDYSDSREKTLECHYQKAQELLSVGDRDGAAREFLMAGTWEDAQKRYSELIYEQAQELYAAGDLKGAQPLFASIPDYEDANEKDMDCRYRIADAAAGVLEYSTVLEMLKDVPDSYRKTGELRSVASYYKAKLAMKQEDWATAAELLRGVNRAAYKNRFKDIESLYQEACSKAGIDPYPVTPEPVPEDQADESGSAVLTDHTAEGTPPRETELRETPGPDPYLVTEDDQP